MSDGHSSSTAQALDILAAIFFIVAGAWLLIALLYSFVVLSFLRMRARGELARIYEEEFGRVYIWGNRYYIPLGCVFRRYIMHLQREQQNRAFANARRRNVRFMTREERRNALEIVFTKKGMVTTAKERREIQGTDGSSIARETECPPSDCDTASPDDSTKKVENGDVVDDTVGCDISTEAPICSICLGEYGQNDQIMNSAVCPHQFHYDCILDWLQRHAITDCPCCRTTLVVEEDIWKVVNQLRKQRRQKMIKDKTGQKDKRDQHETEVETHDIHTSSEAVVADMEEGSVRSSP